MQETRRSKCRGNYFYFRARIAVTPVLTLLELFIVAAMLSFQGILCSVEGCTSSVPDQGSFCFRHGGGRRCAFESCNAIAKVFSDFCTAHGGKVVCVIEGCNSIGLGKKRLCITHGGN